MEQIRKSNIELLRIIAMIMIIGHHYIYYGVQQNYNFNIAYNIFNQGDIWKKCYSVFLIPGGIVGVNIFFLLSGYFGINQNKVKLKRILGVTSFYSVTLFMIYFIFLHLDVVKNTEKFYIIFLRSIFPISNNCYWFITTYFILMLLKPSMNIYIKSSTNKKRMCIILFLLLDYMCCRQINSFLVSFINGIVYYWIGATIQINTDLLKNRKKSKLFLFFIFLVTWCGYSLCQLIPSQGMLNGILNIVETVIMGGVSAVSLFIIMVVYIKEFKSHKLNAIASCTLGVYLLHENPLLREILWQNIFRTTKQYQSNFYVLLSIITIIFLYIVLTLIELIRYKCWRKLS